MHEVSDTQHQSVTGHRSAPEPQCLPLARAIVIASNSNCPSSLWLDRLTPLLASPSKPFVFVNVGSNKGYAVASVVARFGGSSALAAVSNAAWYQAIREYFALNGVKDEAALGRLGWGGSGNTMCGMCCACRDSAPVRAVASSVVVHAIELSSPNVAWLSWAFARFQIPAYLVHAGANNESGYTFAPDRHATPTQMGGETDTLQTRQLRGLRRVRSIALDDYFAEEALRGVDFVSVDTEGFDAAVIDGLMGYLRKRRVRVLEFEYHGIGLWKRERALKDTIAQLHGIGYTCFWQGNFGCLAPLSPPCWNDRFERKVWSNVVCAAEPPLVSELMSITAECQESTKNDPPPKWPYRDTAHHPNDPRRPADLIC